MKKNHLLTCKNHRDLISQRDLSRNSFFGWLELFKIWPEFGPFPGNKMALIWFLSPPNLSMSSKIIIPYLKNPKKCLWTHYISKKWLNEQFESGWMGQNCTVFKIWLLFGPFPGNKMCLKSNISLDVNR